MNKKLAILLSLILLSAAGCAKDNEEYGEVIKQPPEGDTALNPPAANEPVIPKGDGIQPSFADVDANGDGRISKEEAANYEAVADNFPYVDENNDGYLSDVEFEDLKK